MLQIIRDYAQGAVAWVLLIMISVPFALWGVQSYFDSGSETPLATVGDHEFFQRDVNRIYEQNLLSNPELANQENLFKKQALEGLINEAVLTQSTSDAGFLVADDSVRQFIRELPYFQVDGQFSQDSYKGMLAAQGMSSEMFVEQVRRALRSDQLQRGVRESAFITSSELDRYFRLLKETRSGKYFLVAHAESGSPDVTEEEIQSFYDQHITDYMTEPAVRVDYVLLDLADIASEEVISEQQIQDFYQENIDRFTQNERRKASHILFESGDNEKSAIAEALKVRQRILDGDITFADAAREFSKDPGSADVGGDLGLIEKDQMVPEFEEEAFRLGSGEISEPVKTDFGIHLIKITELTDEQVTPLEEVSADIKAELQRQQAESRFYEMAEQLAETAYESPGSLDASSALLGTEIKTTEWFTQEEGLGISESMAVRNAAFSDSVREGNNSEPLETGSDQVVVLRLHEFREAKPKALTEVKEQIADQLQADKLAKAQQELADGLFEKIGQGADLDEVALSAGLEVLPLDKVSRTGGGEMPYGLKQSLFKAAAPQDADSPVPFRAELADGPIAIGIVTQVTPGLVQVVSKEERETASRSLVAGEGRDQFHGYAGILREEADIRYPAAN